MSLSNPQIKNPATRFIQWRGSAEKIVESNVKGGKTERYEGGKLTWYDKENQTDVEIALPFTFIVLDELNTITGFNESQRSGYWSNEVRNISKDILVVRTKQGIQARGTYTQIKERALSGLKYAKSVYIAFKDETDELVIGNIKIAGAALNSWIEFQKQFNVSKCAVQITDTPKLDKKGTNYYYSPVFDGLNMSDSTKEEAITLDKEMQNYLNAYFSHEPDTNDVVVEADEPTEDIHNISGIDTLVTKEEKVEVENLDTETEKPKTTVEKSTKNLSAVKDVEF